MSSVRYGFLFIKALLVTTLFGGANALAQRAVAVLDDDVRVACHLAELAVQAEPDNAAAHEARAHVYQARRNQETSLMAKGIFGSAANESSSRES